MSSQHYVTDEPHTDVLYTCHSLPS